MKKILHILPVFLCCNLLIAQRTADLEVTILQPADNSEIQAMTPMNLIINVKNIGSEPILDSDSLALYYLLNDAPVLFGGGDEFWMFTNMPMDQQQDITITKALAFDNSFAGEDIQICFILKPFNHSNPIQDNNLSNNKECRNIQVKTAVSGIEESTPDQLALYPNPVKNKLSVSGVAISKITITDNAGKTVLNSDSNLNDLDCSMLNNGMYFVSITSDQGQSTRKIIVEK